MVFSEKAPFPKDPLFRTLVLLKPLWVNIGHLSQQLFAPPALPSSIVQRSSGASGGCLHGGASFKVEKAHSPAWKKSGVAPANQTKERAKTKSSWISPTFANSGVFPLEKQARFTLNFCSGMPLRKVHELTFLWFGLPGPLLKKSRRCKALIFLQVWSFDSYALYNLSADDLGGFLWDSVAIAQNRQRTNCTRHASQKIRPAKDLSFYIFEKKRVRESHKNKVKLRPLCAPWSTLWKERCY